MAEPKQKEMPREMKQKRSPKMAEEKMSLKQGRKAKKKARQDKRATKLEAKAKKVRGGSKEEFRATKKKARQDKRSIKKEVKSQTKDARKVRRKKVGRVAAAVATGGKSEIVRAVAKKVKKEGGAKKVIKKLAGKTPVGKAVTAVKAKRKANEPKRKALKEERQSSRETKKEIRKSGPVIAGGMGAGLYDGPGGPEDPKLGRMSEGPSQYSMNKPGMGMYGKGSKISYGMGNTVGKPGSAKVGTGVNKNPSAMVQRGNVLKHMSRNRK
jgi:hypothetical protein